MVDVPRSKLTHGSARIYEQSTTGIYPDTQAPHSASAGKVNANVLPDSDTGGTVFTQQAGIDQRTTEPGKSIHSAAQPLAEQRKQTICIRISPSPSNRRHRRRIDAKRRERINRITKVYSGTHDHGSRRRSLTQDPRDLPATGLDVVRPLQPHWRGHNFKQRLPERQTDNQRKVTKTIGKNPRVHRPKHHRHRKNGTGIGNPTPATPAPTGALIETHKGRKMRPRRRLIDMRENVFVR